MYKGLGCFSFNIIEVEGEGKFCRARGFIHFGLGRLVGVERVMYGYFLQNMNF